MIVIVTLRRMTLTLTMTEQGLLEVGCARAGVCGDMQQGTALQTSM